jgi:hypothetical protein
MNDKLSAEAHLKAALLAFEALTPNTDQDYISKRNAVVAKNVLHEELGYIGEPREPYHLDQDTRDILLKHARQDAAHALANSTSVLRELRTIRKIIVRFAVGVAAVAVIVIAILAVDVLVGR